MKHFKKKEVGIVQKIECIGTDIYSMWIKTEAARLAKPGQFLSIYTKDSSRLLPRPISICDFTEDAIRIVYRVAGQGTKEFSAYTEGEEVSFIGPLGNGFPLLSEDAFLIGGGIGIPPMLALAKKLSCEKSIICGYRNELFLEKELAENGNFYIATEDGSTGTKGNVIDAIKANGLKAKVIYACGPMPMLKAIKQYAEENDMVAYLSLEERMACGIGACLGCVCDSTEVDGHSLVKNKRICTDGPVFLAKEVSL